MYTNHIRGSPERVRGVITLLGSAQRTDQRKICTQPFPTLGHNLSSPEPSRRSHYQSRPCLAGSRTARHPARYASDFAGYVDAGADVLLRLPNHPGFEETAGSTAMGSFNELRVPASLDQFSAAVKDDGWDQELQNREFILVSTATGTRASREDRCFALHSTPHMTATQSSENRNLY